MDNLEIDYKKAAQQLRSGEALFGKDGALAPLLELSIFLNGLQGCAARILITLDRTESAIVRFMSFCWRPCVMF